MKKIQRILIIFFSICTLNVCMPFFAMKKDKNITGEKRKRDNQDIQKGKTNKKRKLDIGDQKVEEIKSGESCDSQAQQKEEKDKCTICLDDLSANSKKLDCDHVFHTACIDHWFGTSNTCPLCRNPEFCFVCKAIFNENDKKTTRHSCNHTFHTHCFESENIVQRCPLCPQPQEQPQLPAHMRLLRSESFFIAIDTNHFRVHAVNQRLGGSVVSMQLRESLFNDAYIVEDRFLVLEYEGHEVVLVDLSYQKQHSIKLREKKHTVISSRCKI